MEVKNYYLTLYYNKYTGALFINEINSVKNYIDEYYIYLYMHNISYNSNVAEIAGGALMVDNPWVLAIECNGSTHTVNPSEIGLDGTYSITDFDSSTLKNIYCENWQNNTVYSI